MDCTSYEDLSLTTFSYNVRRGAFCSLRFSKQLSGFRSYKPLLSARKFSRSSCSMPEWSRIMPSCVAWLQVSKKSLGSLVVSECEERFFNWSSSEWLMHNLKKQLGVRGEYEWPLVFGVAVWKLLFWRNKAESQSIDSSYINLIPSA